MGYDTNQYCFCDIFGFDEELVNMVPQPCKAVMLCYPISKSMDFRENLDDAFLNPKIEDSRDLYFIKQTVCDFECNIDWKFVQ